eukprot:s1812_g7.t1
MEVILLAALPLLACSAVPKSTVLQQLRQREQHAEWTEEPRMPGNAVLGHWGSNCGAVQEAVDEEEHLCLGTAHTCLYFKPMVRVSCDVSDMRLLPSSISREGHSLSLGLAADWEGEPPFDHDSDLTGLSLQSSEAMGVGTLGRRKQCRHSHTGQLAAALQRMSDPNSPDYGKFFSQAELQALTKPRDADIEAAERFLHRGHPQRDDSGTFVTAVLHVSTVHEMMGGRVVKLCRSGQADTSHRRCFLRHRGGSVPPQLDGSCDVLPGLASRRPPQLYQ